MGQFTPAEWRGEVVWLLEADWYGRTLRWASTDVVVTTDDGDTLEYPAGLVVDWTDGGAMFDGYTAASVSLGALPFPDDVSIAQEIERGRWVERIRGELSQWVSGRTYEQRVIRVTGALEVGEYDDDSQPVSLALAPDGIETGALVPPASWEVNAETWSTAGADLLGRFYPVTYGRPGIADVAEAWAAQPLDEATGGNDWVVAGHPIEATTLRVFEVGGGGLTATVAVERLVDGLGQVISTIDYTTGGIIHVNWQHSGSNGGGLVGPGGLVTGAGSVLIDLLHRSGVRFDASAWEAVRSQLDAYTLDFWINEPVDAWQFALEHVVPLVPISLRSGPDGVAPVLWRFGATASDAVAALTIGTDVFRRGGVQIERPSNRAGVTAPANEITLRYAPRGDDGSPYYSATVGPAGVAGVQASAGATASRSVFGARRYSVETRVVYDRATALRVLGWWSAAFAFPWRSLLVDDPAREWAWLAPGDVVTVTDATLHLSAKVAVVRAVVWADTVPSYDLVLIHNPARDVRA